MKGESAYRLLAKYQQIRRQLWGRHVWTRGYFTRSSGNETDEVIKAYASTALSTSIENQAQDSDDDFHIDGE